VTPNRKAVGESLLYEVQYGPNHELVKNMYTLEGKGANSRATLWQGDDVFQAERFVNDQRFDTFRIMGGPVAVIKVPANPNAPPKRPAPAGGGMTPSMSLNGGKIKLEADGEMLYQSALGKVQLTRNVMIQQEASEGQGGFRINSDEAQMTMALPPPGQQADTASASVFSGDLKMLDCTGRVEVRTSTQTILCDRARFDMDKHLFIMEMKVPTNSVRVYMPETPAAGKVLVALKRLTVNMETNEFESAVSSHMEAFTGMPPSIRNPAPSQPPLESAPNGKAPGSVPAPQK